MYTIFFYEFFRIDAKWLGYRVYNFFLNITLEYTFLNNNTPHSEQRRTVLIRQLLHTVQWKHATQLATPNYFNQTNCSRANSCRQSIDWLDTEKLTFILKHPPSSDRVQSRQLSFSIRLIHCYWELNDCLTLSSLNLPLSSSSTTSRELLSQFSTCSGWRWFEVGKNVRKLSCIGESLVDVFLLKILNIRKMRSVFRYVKWYFDAS